MNQNFIGSLLVEMSAHFFTLDQRDCVGRPIRNHMRGKFVSCHHIVTQVTILKVYLTLSAIVIAVTLFRLPFEMFFSAFFGYFQLLGSVAVRLTEGPLLR